MEALILENWRSLLVLAWNMLNWKIQLNANTPSERISTLCTWQCKNQMRWNPKYLPTSLEFWIQTTHCIFFKTCYSSSFKFSQHLCMLKYLQSLSSKLLEYSIQSIITSLDYKSQIVIIKCVLYLFLSFTNLFLNERLLNSHQWKQKW